MYPGKSYYYQFLPEGHKKFRLPGNDPDNLEKGKGNGKQSFCNKGFARASNQYQLSAPRIVTDG
jgi:hypothetical protein